MTCIVKLPRGDAAACDWVRTVVVVKILKVAEGGGGAVSGPRRGTVCGGTLTADQRNCKGEVRENGKNEGTVNTTDKGKVIM